MISGARYERPEHQFGGILFQFGFSPPVLFAFFFLLSSLSSLSSGGVMFSLAREDVEDLEDIQISED
ncbi:MAG: hypothetical protein WC789_13335 [Lentisphaeria bacterium]|jgi:hypothetical protein